jgi:hypothetical protein
MTVTHVTLGQVVATPGALEALTAAGVSAMSLLDRHGRGDWGEVGREDWRANDWSLANGERLLSAYTVGAVKVWLITERDRSATTLLLPDEY